MYNFTPFYICLLAVYKKNKTKNSEKDFSMYIM